MRHSLLLFLLATSCVGNTLTLALKYNEVQMKASHNSYERREGVMDQLLYHACRSIEYDLHPAPARGRFGIYHDAGYFRTYSSLQTLQDGVQTLKEFHEIMPNHHVVTIWMDLKVTLGTTHTAQDLDATLGQLPLYTPRDAAANETTIKGGIDAHGWPELEDLRGKFIWVITSGQDSYCMSDVDCIDRNAFVAVRSVETASDIGTTTYKVFYNQASTYENMGQPILEAGYIGRIYDLTDIDSVKKWDSAIDNKFHHITTDKMNVHQDRYSRTHNLFGYPFQAMNSSVSVTQFRPEEGNLMYMGANTGDTWGRLDDLNFAFFIDNVTVNNTGEWFEYTTHVSLVNSHCDKFAKAGLMIRQESNDPKYPLGSGQYFAVMRTCNHFIRIQHRDLAYVFTEENVLPVLNFTVDGIEDAKRTGLKLRARYEGNDTICEGYFKHEGTDIYGLIGKQTFRNVHLNLHGLFASSHYWDGNADGSDFKALFVDTRRNNETLVAADFRKPDGDDFEFGDGFDDARPTTLLPEERSLNSYSLRGVN